MRLCEGESPFAGLCAFLNVMAGYLRCPSLSVCFAVHWPKSAWPFFSAGPAPLRSGFWFECAGLPLFREPLISWCFFRCPRFLKNLHEAKSAFFVSFNVDPTGCRRTLLGFLSSVLQSLSYFFPSDLPSTRAANDVCYYFCRSGLRAGFPVAGLGLQLSFPVS